MRRQAPQPDEQFGPYRLLQRIADGGMGTVFLAETDAFGARRQRVVVKVLQPELSEQREMRAMFMHEARLGSQLRHPGIAQIYTYGDEDGVLFLVMEYVDGAALSTIMQRMRGQVPLPAALRVVRDVASVLAYAHGAAGPDGEPLQLVHRDVTPQNVLVSKSGIVKLIDFGVAKSTGQDHRTRTGVLKGKLGYMAPELFRGEALQQSDVFALGVVLHELVSGKRLFKKATEAETFAAVLVDPIPPLRASPEIAAVLQPIVDRALSRDLGLRYASAAELETDLVVAIDQLDAHCVHDDLIDLVAIARRAREPATALEASSSGLRETREMAELDDRTVRSDPSARGPFEDFDAGASWDEGVEGAVSGGGGDARLPAGAPAAPPAAGVAVMPTRPDWVAKQAQVAAAPAPAAEAPAFATPPAAPARPRAGRALLYIGATIVLLAAGAGTFYFATAGDRAVAPQPPSPTAATPLPEERPAQPLVVTPGTVAAELTPEPDAREEPEPAVPSEETPPREEPRVEPRERRVSAEPRPRPRREEAATAPAESGTGRLFLDSDPWTFVRVGGRSLGQTPVVDAELPAGSHNVELRTSDGRTERVRVRIVPGQPTKRFVRVP